MKIKKFFYLLFFTLLVAFLLIWKKNSFSKNVLVLNILGSPEVTAGQANSFLVKYKNQGNVVLENARLYFQCPEESFSDKGEKIEETELDNIYPGQEKSFSFRCVVWGKEKELKEVVAWIVFQPKNLKSKFEVKNSFHFEISKTPLNFEVDLPSKIEKDKVFRFYLYYFSNSSEPISRIQIKPNFPSGFQLISLSPSFSTQENWTIDQLDPGEGGKIEIQGMLSGVIGEAKNFSFSVFYDTGKKLITLKEVSKKVIVEKTTLFLRQEINGSPNFIASAGDNLHYAIYFKNIGNQPLEKLNLIS
ncbi:MAG: hypothetical protein ACPLZH_00795, partial [Minisyncoccales bacterium]